MKGLIPYIKFDGHCEEVLNYYQTVFGGEIATLMPFKGAPMSLPAAWDKKVMHSEFRFGECVFMACDAMPGDAPTEEGPISMSLGTTNVNQTEKWFTALAKEGVVTMPLQDTFWGAKFGIVKDKYGINWMFNCEQPK